MLDCSPEWLVSSSLQLCKELISSSLNMWCKTNHCHFTSSFNISDFCLLSWNHHVYSWTLWSNIALNKTMRTVREQLIFCFFILYYLRHLMIVNWQLLTVNVNFKIIPDELKKYLKYLYVFIWYKGAHCLPLQDVVMM